MSGTNDDYTTPVALERQPENRVLMHVDAQGYAVRTGGWYGMHFLRADEASFDFLKFMRDGLLADPLPPEDLVMPTPLWQVDDDGRGLSAMEHTQLVALAALLQLNDFTHTLTTQTRKAA